MTDGTTAFVGGMNIGLGMRRKKMGGRNWRDTHMRIEGPAARSIEYFSWRTGIAKAAP